jgi:hypothetical protein
LNVAIPIYNPTDVDEGERRVSKRRKVSGGAPFFPSYLRARLRDTIDSDTPIEEINDDSSTESEDEPLSSVTIVDSTQPSQEQGAVALPIPASEVSTKKEGIRQPLSSYVCPVCFSAPNNACALACGHVFCGSCLFAAVKSGIKRGEMGGGNEGIVPRFAMISIRTNMNVLI